MGMLVSYKNDDIVAWELETYKMVTFKSDMEVELVDYCASDEQVARAAWVSSGADVVDVSEKRLKGLIRALMRDRHGSPFEAGYFSFKITTTRGVHTEHIRHRAGWSYSASSLRYVEHAPVCYVPPRERPLQKAESFKQIKPVYVPLDNDLYEKYTNELRRGYEASYKHYQAIKELGIDSTEALRFLTHDGLFMTYHARCNPRSLMHFLGLRTHESTASHTSYPMFEIEGVARQMEKHFAEKMPTTYEAWTSLGRESP